MSEDLQVENIFIFTNALANMHPSEDIKGTSSKRLEGKKATELSLEYGGTIERKTPEQLLEVTQAAKKEGE